jgi:peptidoglycan/LPS O-acetylase OafA/YrhL
MLPAGVAVLLVSYAYAGPGVGRLTYAIGYGVSYTAFSATFAGMLGLALRGGVITKVCEQRSLRWLGKYSYGLYVLHLPLFTYLQQPVRHMLERPLHENKAAVVVGTGVLCFGVSVVAAYASYNLYERRFLRLKRFFDYKRPGEKIPIADSRRVSATSAP